jgi:hypothetical protein
VCAPLRCQSWWWTQQSAGRASGPSWLHSACAGAGTCCRWGTARAPSVSTPVLLSSLRAITATAVSRCVIVMQWKCIRAQLAAFGVRRRGPLLLSGNSARTICVDASSIVRSTRQADRLNHLSTSCQLAHKACCVSSLMCSVRKHMWDAVACV